MHGSAHDKAQRRRDVLQRGKCVQRALRGVVTRLRTRRTLVATAALVLLVLLLAFLELCHARLLSQRPAPRDCAHDNAAADAVTDDSTSHVTASPSDRWLLRPDTQHSGSVRVMLLMLSTRVDAPLCYALALAFFADLPVVVVGYGTRPFVNAMKPSLYLDAIERAALRDRDVVLLLDRDILFSGEDMLPFIDDYIARSPAAPSTLDARAVRAGTARAPSLFAAESNCFAPETLALTHDECASLYAHTDHAIAAYIAKHNLTYDLHNASAQPLRYLNSGVSIHRVWSVRELLRAYVQYIATHTPRNDKSKQWHDDQSVFALFYNDLRAWEVEHDVLRNNSNTVTAATQRGPHGLRAGQLQLEQTGRLSTGFVEERRCLLTLTDELWRGNATRAPHEQVLLFADAKDYMDAVWRRYGGSVRLRQRTLTRAGNGTHTIDLTPPVLSLPPRHIYGKQRPAVRIYPPVLHMHGRAKARRTRIVVQTLPWYTPMHYNMTRLHEGRKHLLASLVELWTATTNTTRHARYGDVCRSYQVLR